MLLVMLWLLPWLAATAPDFELDSEEVPTVVVVTGLEFEFEFEFELEFDPETAVEPVVMTGFDCDAELEPESAPEVDVAPAFTTGFDCESAPEMEPEIDPEFDVDWDNAVVPDIIAIMATAVQSFFMSRCPIL